MSYDFEKKCKEKDAEIARLRETERLSWHCFKEKDMEIARLKAEIARLNEELTKLQAEGNSDETIQFLEDQLSDMNRIILQAAKTRDALQERIYRIHLILREQAEGGR